MEKFEYKLYLMAKDKKKMNLYDKISEVLKDIEYLTKDDNVGTGKSSYKAISEEKVTRSVRASLIKNGIVILPIEQHTEEIFTEYEKLNYDKKLEKKQRLMTRVDVKYKIVNIDNPEEFEILVSSGSGVDSQDKGVGKAMTYSYKYMLLRTFAIPTGEDPDKFHNDDLDDQSQEQEYKVTTEMLVSIAKQKGYTEQQLCSKYKVKEVKFIKQDVKKEAYCKLKTLKDKS